jgi:MarC family integral membrane protein
VNALFALVNPIGGSPVFLPLTQEYVTQERKLRAGRVAVNSFILLIVSFVVGTHILWFSGFRCRSCRLAAVVPSGINVIFRLSAFFADVHRRADLVERSECAGAYAPRLGRALSLVEALFMHRNRWCQSRMCAPACIIEIECMRTRILLH